MDSRKQKAVQLFKNGAVKQLEGGFAVRSQNSKKYYFVDNNGACNCPDCQFNGTKICKHSYAVKFYLGIEKADGTVEKVKLTYRQAWGAYNQAQQVEIKMFDELLKDLVADIAEPEYCFGRPTLSIKDTAFCVVQKVYSQLSSRRAKSLFNKALEAEQVKHSPYFNVVSAFLNKETTTPLLQELLKKTAEPLKAVESKFAIDSSGFRTTRFTEYCRDKHGVTKKHEYIKVHICCGTKTNIITGAVITKSEGEGTGDSTQLPELVEQTSQNFNVKEYSADKAYSSRENLQLIANKNATPFIPFRNNAKPRAGGVPIWKRMFHYFNLHQDEFMEHYHARSNVETTFFMVKAKLGDSVKSKNFTAQKNELLCKLIAHNIIVLIQEIHELGIQVNFCTKSSEPARLVAEF